MPGAIGDGRGRARLQEARCRWRFDRGLGLGLTPVPTHCRDRGIDSTPLGALDVRSTHSTGVRVAAVILRASNLRRARLAPRQRFCPLAGRKGCPKMPSIYAEKRITRLDMCFGGSLAVVALALGTNTAFRSVHAVYVAILVVLGGLGYCTERCEGEKESLRRLWVLGLLSVVLYPLIDSLFEAQLGLVTYLTDDPRLIATPVYVPLYWVLGVLIFGYVYYRVYGLTKRVWIGALATGLFSAASATLVENLFNAAGFYHNAPVST